MGEFAHASAVSPSPLCVYLHTYRLSRPPTIKRLPIRSARYPRACCTQRHWQADREKEQVRRQFSQSRDTYTVLLFENSFAPSKMPYLTHILDAPRIARGKVVARELRSATVRAGSATRTRRS